MSNRKLPPTKPLPSGMTAAVVYLFCTGWVHLCPYKKAEKTCERILRLTGPFTKKDKEVLEKEIYKHFLFLNRDLQDAVIEFYSRARLG